MKLPLCFYFILIFGDLAYSQRPPPGQGGPPQQPPGAPPGAPPPGEEEEEPCRHATYEPSGEFESPNYPENYPDNGDCMYRIFTDKYVNVYFEDFNIEETRDCTYDYLQVILDAMSPDSAPERYCGAGLEKIEGGHLRGKGPVILMFKSDESDTRKGFKFKYEFELDGPDPCDSDPCQHGGSCERLVGHYRCHCVDGYVGVNCEIDKDDCASYPCEHGGHCQDQLNNYTCECINGFAGATCEIEPDPCESNPCQNGGLCTNRIPDFVCSCPRTFMGDACEEEVPTLPPPTTTTPPPDAETEPAEVDTTTTAEPKDDDGGEEDDPKNDESQGSEGDGGRGGVIAAIVIILLLALLLAGLFAWYWFKHLRKRDNDDRRLEKEVTLINMKTRAELGKKGKATSRTTSINVMNSKGTGNRNQFLNELQRMSQDIIMEEVNGDDEHGHPRKRRGESLQTQKNRFSQHDVTDMGIPKRMARDEMAYVGNKPSLAGMAFGQERGPMNISPDDAVLLLNYLKNNGGKKCDLPTALEAVQSNKDAMRRSLHPPRPQYHTIPQNAPQRDSRKVHTPGDESIDLTPEEAAEVVNDLLQRSPGQRPLKPHEALAVMQDVRGRRFRDRNSRIDREKTVVLNPEEVANVVNSFNNRNGGNRNYQGMPPRGKMYRNKYSPIMEEESLVDESHHIHDQYSEIPSENYTEPSPRPKQKRLPYANTIDPDEKVNDWLQSSPKRKKPRTRPYSPTNSAATETHTVTRVLPSTQRNKNKASKSQFERDMTIVDYDYDPRSSAAVPRTIRQTRVKVPNDNNRNSLPVTQNKAKSLVEKLIRAPARSNQNVVGPSLGVKRQNAFLD